MQKLIAVGWLFLLALSSGIAMALFGKPLQAPVSVVHKLSAVACIVFLILRIGVAIRLFESRPTLLATIAMFVIAFLAAFVSGIVESIPAQASGLWLNLHRIAAIVAAIACAAAWRLAVAKLH